MEEFLSNIITDEDLSRIQPGEFNIIQAPRGWGKTEFMFDERILQFASEKKYVLYLIHNTMTRDAIAAKYKDKVCVYDLNYNSAWFDHRRKHFWTPEEDENKIHIMCYQTFSAILRNVGTDWLDDIELIIWDEFDDIHTWYKRDLKNIKKVLPNFSRDVLVSLLQDGHTASMANFIYQIKRTILEPGRIILLAITATPENAASYFSDYINYIIKGQLEEKYRAQETIFINDVIASLTDGTIAPKNGKYWCYTRYITEGQAIALNAKARGFNPIVLWSRQNTEWQHNMTEEQKEVLDLIINQGTVPPAYDFIIITAVGNRGINIYDKTIQNWICNSTEYEDIQQFLRARYNPERQYLLEEVRGLVNFTQKGIPEDYFQWHSVKELRKMVEEQPIFSKGLDGKPAVKLSTFNAVRKEYAENIEKRIYGRCKETQYRFIAA